MKVTIVFAAVALFVATYSFPVEESSWNAQDTELIQYDRVEHSKNEAETADSTATKMAGKEEKWEKREERRTEEAKKLAKEQSDITTSFKKDLAKQQEKLKLDNADAEQKIGEAVQATSAAEAELKTKNEEYEKYMKALKKEGKEADAESQKRLKEYNEAIEKLNGDIQTEKDNKAAAEKSLKDNHEEYLKEKKDREEAYKKEEEGLEKKETEMKEGFEKEKKEHDEKFAKEFKSNADAYEGELTKLESERKADIKAAKEAKEAIKKDYDAKEKAAEKAEEDYQKVQADEAKALKEKRDAKKKEVDLQATKDEAAYQAEMEKVEGYVADAKKADKAQKDFAKKAAAAQTIREGLSEKQFEKDAAIAKCKDEVQCMDKDTHECKDLTADGPYLADDLVHCSDEKGDWDTATDTDAVDSWMGEDAIGAEPTPPPVVPSEECLKRIEALPEAAHTAYAAYKKDHNVNPLEYMLCTDKQSPGVGHFVPRDDLTNQDMRDDLTQIFDMLNVCPDICFPDTAETVENDNGSVTSDESICIDKSDWAALKEQVIDIPTYKNSGTKTKDDPKGRFPAGKSTDVCTFVKAMAEGFRGGSGEDTTPGEDTLAQKPHHDHGHGHGHGPRHHDHGHGHGHGPRRL